MQSFRRVVARDHGEARLLGFDALLRQLAAFDATPERALSLFLDVAWRDEQQRERTRLFVAQAFKRERGRLGDGEADRAVDWDLGRAAELVEERLRQAVDPSDRGCALYLCRSRGLELAVRLAVPTTDALYVGPTLELRPLLACAMMAIAVWVDRQSADLVALSPSGSVPVESLTSDVPKRHKQGGWSQLKLQHDTAEHLEAHERAVAGAIARAVGDDPRARVVLDGRDEVVAGVERHLPTNLRQRLLRPQARHRDGNWLASGAAAVREVEGRTSRALLDELTGAGAAGPQAAAGVVGVLEAANQHRLRHLLISDRFERPGWRCLRCGAIGDGTDARRCLHCGGEVQPSELGQLVVRQAVAEGGSVSVVAANRDVIAATLRF